MTKVISFINYKGGVGKTTSCFNIGQILAYEHNKNVLLVDLDPQTNATFLTVSITDWDIKSKERKTVLEIFSSFTNSGGIFNEDVRWKNPQNEKDKEGNEIKFDLIPGNIDLIDYEDKIFKFYYEQLLKAQFSDRIFEEQSINRLSILKSYLIKYQNEYDYILIDCPPNLSVITQNGLFMSDYFIITAIPDHLSRIGLEFLERKVDQMTKRWNSWGENIGVDIMIPKSLCILIVKVPRRGRSGIPEANRKNIQEISSIYGEKVLKNMTSESSLYSEAAYKLLPIFKYKKAKKFKSQYEGITQEILKKVEGNN
jgi:chromosome partitioning protein